MPDPKLHRFGLSETAPVPIYLHQPDKAQGIVPEPGEFRPRKTCMPSAYADMVIYSTEDTSWSIGQLCARGF